MYRVATYAIFSLFSFSCLADGSPWLPIPESGTVSLSYVFQTADEFYRADNKVPTPGGGEDLEQQTIWLGLNYGLDENLALDIKTGYAKSQFVTGPGIPTTDESFENMTDTTVGVTWRFVDEDISEYGLPSMAIRAASIVAANYDTGYINSIGDGGSGAETSLIVGKIFADTVAVSGEIGYRFRTHNIPNESFFNLRAYYLLGALTASLEYQWNNAVSGLDIGGPGFTPSKFPLLEEDFQVVGLGVSYNVTNTINLGLNLATVIEGRNTNATEAIGISVGYTFDHY